MSKYRLAFGFFFLAIALGLGVWLGTTLSHVAGVAPASRTYDTAAILKQVQTLAQLVTVKYVMEKVVVLEDVRWYGESRVLLVAHGIVKAGMDLNQLRPSDLRVTGAKIRVTLPLATITDVYLDDQQTQVVERTTGLLRRIDKDMEQNARRTAVDDLRRAARQSGILREANERARLQITCFLRQMGFEEIEITAP